MRLLSSVSISAALLALSAPLVRAENLLTSTSLAPCQSNNSFSATLFDVTFTPANKSLAFNINGLSTVEGHVTIELVVYAYGLKVYTHPLNPCEQHLEGLCPMRTAPITINSNAPVDDDSLSQVPGITYTVPDLDAKVQAYFISNTTGKSLACVEATLSNGKTVDQLPVKWIIAIISGLGLVASAITSGLGHSNTAAHVAANVMALFGYFQAQALIGMSAVPLPPVVASWTQNFQWSMGIIKVGFIQDIATWYQRATGGTPTTVLSSLATTSVQVQKRALPLLRRAADLLAPAMLKARDTTTEPGKLTVIKGIERVGFRAGIELTNIFLTGYIFFIIFVVFVVIGVLAFKGVCELLTRTGHMHSEKFKDFRNGWNTILKGILFRITLIGFSQMVVLCFYEFTRKDSSAEVVLAVFTVFAMIFTLAWAASKVIRLARRSIAMHKNPAYILYSDPVSLNKWGFLYVQFKATAYFFIVPLLVYLLVKGLFIALGQGSGVAQAIALVIIEAAFMIAVCVLRPYMDKKTNAFNISIAVINFVSALFLLVFTGIFNQPGIVTGVMGVVFFVYNAAFSTILLIIVLIASFIAIAAKNPETRYQPMRDDRGSFIKSQTQLTTELDALGATARGETKHEYYGGKGARIEDDDSFSGDSGAQKSVYNSNSRGAYSSAPTNENMTQIHSDNLQPRHAPAAYTNRSNTASPYRDDYSRNASMTSQPQQRARNNGPSPWQRGAGYD